MKIAALRWLHAEWLATGALVRKEVLVLARMRRGVLLLGLLIAASAAFVATTWPENEPLMQMGFTAFFIFGALSMVLMGAAAALLPGVSGAAFISEYSNDTATLLDLTLLRPRHLVLGKILGSAGYYLLFVAGCAPILALPFFLPGIEPAVLIWVIAFILMNALTVSCAGVYCSLRSNSVTNALRLSFVFMLVIMGLLHIPACMMLGVIGQLYGIPDVTMPIISFIAATTPPYALAEVLGVPSALAGSVWLAPYALSTSVAYHAVLFAAFFWMSCRRARTLLINYEAMALPKKWWQWRPWRRQAPAYVPRPRRTVAFSDTGNPVYWKEWWFAGNTSVLRKPKLTFLAVFLMSCCFAVPLYSDAYRDVRLGAPIVFDSMYWRQLHLLAVVQFALGLVLLPTFIVPIFTRDYERNTRDSLYMSLLSPNEIVFGKLRAGLSHMFPVFAGLVAAAIPPLLILFSPYALAFMMAAYLTLAVSVAWGGALCACIASFLRKPSAALSSATLALIMAFGGIWAMFTFLDFVTMTGSSEKSFLNAFTSPVLALFWSVYMFPGGPLTGRDAVWSYVASGGLLYWLSNLALFAFLAAATAFFSVSVYEARQTRES